MPKRKDESGIKGLSLTGHAFLNSEKGYYLEGFQTTIKRATQKDVHNAEKYGLELVSRYIKIDQRLLYLHKINEEHTLSTTTMIYQVRSGIIINGKLYITVQILDLKHITIMYNYRYRTESRTYFETVDVDNRINHVNEFDMNKRKSKWIQHRNKQELIRRKFKER